MRKSWLLALALLPMGLAGCARPIAYVPPPAYNAVAREGYYDGVRAARFDLRAGLRGDADRHNVFHHPPVAPALRQDYRQSFRQGYAAVYSGEMRHGS